MEDGGVQGGLEKGKTSTEKETETKETDTEREQVELQKNYDKIRGELWKKGGRRAKESEDLWTKERNKDRKKRGKESGERLTIERRQARS